jgi:hypothetical protein
MLDARVPDTRGHADDSPEANLQLLPHMAAIPIAASHVFA